MGPLETDQSTRGRELVELLEEVAPGSQLMLEGGPPPIPLLGAEFVGGLLAHLGEPAVSATTEHPAV